MIDILSPRPIGGTSVTVGGLGLGTAALGNLYRPVSDQEAADTLAMAARYGLRYFDTAPFYGHGLAETRLARHLTTAAGSDATVSTKVGRVLDPGPADSLLSAHFVAPMPFRPRFDYSRAGIRRSLEESLARLGRSHIDIGLLHDIDRPSHPRDHRAIVRQIFEEALPELQRLREEGMVRAIGLGINNWEVGYELLTSVNVDCVLLAGRNTLLDQSAFTSGFLDACARRGVAVIAAGVFNSGLLVGGGTYDYGEAAPELRDRTASLAHLCARHHVPLPAVALQCAAAHPGVTSVLVGPRSPLELGEIIRWARLRVPAELWEELRATGVVPRDVPVPAGAAR